VQPWAVIDRADSPDGVLELRRRGTRDFLITVAGRVLMSSAAQRSERALAELACGPLADRSAPRLLIGGLGMGITLRAALDSLPCSARVFVAELHPTVVGWCRGPLAELTDGAVDDPRVEVLLEDVAAVIRRASAARASYDAILLDLFAGPHAGSDGRADPFYGSRALTTTRRALTDEGVLGVWAEAPDAAFERRLAAAGFAVTLSRPGRGGLRHAVYLARPARTGRGGSGRPTTAAD
jgi:spermidine synthase